MHTQRAVILTWTVLLGFLVFPLSAVAEDNEVEFRGTIESMPSSSILGEWVVAGHRVRVTSGTEIEAEKGAPAIGAFVVVKGYQWNSVVRAKAIKVERAAPGGGSGGDSGGDGSPGGGAWRLIAWNDLGMHCTDGKDFSVFTMLPPANTINAQIVDPAGKLVGTQGGINVTYRAIADPAGSVNSTSRGKTNFWTYVRALFGVDLPEDQGLAGFGMPGSSNLPQAMKFDPAHRWFTAEWIPITPYDDSGIKNYYPMMRLTATDSSGAVLASTDVTLPVSDEMDCQSCHAAGSVSLAAPSGGWIFHGDPEKEFKLNILALHDDRQSGDPAYAAALGQAGYNAAGLLATVQQDSTPVLCARCHPSNALPGSGFNGVKPLTQALHGYHASVNYNGLPLDHVDNRSACYSCHPGAVTRCLRGAMGAAVAHDGTLAMQCQDCHGSMSDVGDPARNGWFDEPECQSCHTGTAIRNNGQIRYTSVFEPSGAERQAVDNTFAVNAGKLYRFSEGHGGLQCSACHGSPHATYPSSHENDNVQNIALQGHAGTLAECTTCHARWPDTVSRGPHGLHPFGEDWAEDGHADAAERNPSQCQACHGPDYRGTELSRALGDRAFQTEFGAKVFWKGFQIGCYTCHNGPSDDERSRNRPAQVSDAAISTTLGEAVSVQLNASDPDGNGLTLRVVSQATNGTVGLSGRTATYHPFPGFRGADRFTYSAWDGSTDSNLGVVTVNVR